MAFEGSLPYSLEPITEAYPEQNESNRVLTPYFRKLCGVEAKNGAHCRNRTMVVQPARHHADLQHLLPLYRPESERIKNFKKFGAYAIALELPGRKAGMHGRELSR